MKSKFLCFHVYLNNKKIDEVHYQAGMTIEEVRKSLINHDGYSPMVVVRPERLSQTVL